VSGGCWITNLNIKDLLLTDKKISEVVNEIYPLNNIRYMKLTVEISISGFRTPSVDARMAD